MKFPDYLDFEVCIGSHTLLHGETNTNKTFYTAQFVKYLLENKNFNKKTISILDFAPKFHVINGLKVGGRIEDYYPESLNCEYNRIENEIIPPRFNANNKKELYKNAYHNYMITANAIQQYQRYPTPVLIINDISIHLHIGNKKKMLNMIKETQTFFGNTYYGTSITKKFARLFSLKEKKRTKYLIDRIENSHETS